MSDPTVMERLRSETRELHDSAENRRFQQRMVAGELSREDYARFLGQMLLVHRALEEPLRRLWQEDARFRAVREEQFQPPYLLADLAALGADPASVQPLGATAALIARIEDVAAERPLEILAFHYVLEGSNNGNRFIAKKLAPALDVSPEAGARYLDPYGAEQRAKWADFKADMNAVGFSDDEADTLVQAACTMFQAVASLSDELFAQTARGD